MNLHAHAEVDLMPPAFVEGLDDWSRGDGTPESPTYDAAENARLAPGDADFGTCLELRTTGRWRGCATWARCRSWPAPTSRWRCG